MRAEEEADLQDLFDRLVAEEALSAGNPDYDYRLGVAALALGRTLVAINALERVVLVQPAHAGAWLDLALAHLQFDDRETARNLLRHVSDNFDPPPELKRRIDALRSRLDRAPSNRAWGGHLAVQYGRVRNANNGFGSPFMTLTPGGASQPIPVEIASEHLARPDTARQISGFFHYPVAHGSGRSSELFVTLRSRHYLTETGNDFTDAGMSWAHTLPIDLPDSTQSVQSVPSYSGRLFAQVGGGMRYLGYGNQTLGQIWNLHGTLRYRFDRCQISLRSDWENRRYRRGGYHDSLTPWLGGGLECATPVADFYLGHRQGRDTPDGNRPGGTVGRAETTLLARRTLIPGLTLDGMIFQARYLDDEGYSPLLENNARRRIERTGYRLSLQWRLPESAIGTPLLTLDHERTRDASNLELFRIEDRQWFLGLLYRF